MAIVQPVLVAEKALWSPRIGETFS